MKKFSLTIIILGCVEHAVYHNNVSCLIDQLIEQVPLQGAYKKQLFFSPLTLP